MVGMSHAIGSTMARGLAATLESDCSPRRARVPVRTAEEVLTPREERPRLRRRVEAVNAREAGESEAVRTTSAHTPKVRQS
jgi:hypothetical protein